MEQQFKTCKRCKKAQPIENFHKNEKTVDGKKSICADCVSETTSERIKINKQKDREFYDMLSPINLDWNNKY